MLNRILNHKKLDLKKNSSIERGEIVQFTSEDVALVKWKDNRAVLMASNCNGRNSTSSILGGTKKTSDSSMLLFRK